MSQGVASSRSRLLRESVSRRSGVLPRPESARSSSHSVYHSVGAAPSQVPLQPGATVVTATGHGIPLELVAAQLAMPASAPPSSSAPLQPTSPPQPLFPPTTLLVGDSIIRYSKFANAITHCFPGATVLTILDKLPSLLQSAAPSIHRLIIHVGTSDTARGQSKLTKLDFRKTF